MPTTQNATPVASMFQVTDNNGDMISAQFDAVVAWVNAAQQRQGTREFLNSVRVHLASGHSFMLRTMSDVFTPLMREHYGEEFDSLFLGQVKETVQGCSVYIRKTDIAGWTKTSGGSGVTTVHLRGNHEIQRVSISLAEQASTLSR